MNRPFFCIPQTVNSCFSNQLFVGFGIPHRPVRYSQRKFSILTVWSWPGNASFLSKNTTIFFYYLTTMISAILKKVRFLKAARLHRCSQRSPFLPSHYPRAFCDHGWNSCCPLKPQALYRRDLRLGAHQLPCTPRTQPAILNNSPMIFLKK